MTTFLAYIGLFLLILKGLAPFFSTIQKDDQRREIDRTLGFTSDRDKPIL